MCYLTSILRPLLTYTPGASEPLRGRLSLPTRCPVMVNRLPSPFLVTAPGLCTAVSSDLGIRGRAMLAGLVPASSVVVKYAPVGVVVTASSEY